MPRDHAPIRLVKSLPFRSSGGALPHNSPDFIRISPNGRYITLGNSNEFHMFDLEAPHKSWKQFSGFDELHMVTPTDSGRFWIHQQGDVTLMEAPDRRRFSLRAGHARAIWGNDHWLLIHEGNRLRFVRPDADVIHSTIQRRLILHAWMHDQEHVRMLCISRTAKYLHLYEWSPGQGGARSISVHRYRRKFLFRDIEPFYGITQHVHAWPQDDGGVTVKLLPFSVRVTCDGAIEPISSSVSWHPIYSDDAFHISRQRVAELTICALDGNVDPSAPLGHAAPFPITTLITADSIHVITTLWHKVLAHTDTDQISDEELNDCIEDPNSAVMLLENTEGALPHLDNLLDVLLLLSTEKKHRNLFRSRIDSIVSLFRETFRISMKSLAEGNDEKPDLCYVHTTLTTLAGFSPMFDAFCNELLQQPESDVRPYYQNMLLQVRTLVPALKKSVRNMLPEQIRTSAIPPLEAIRSLDDTSACFLLGVLPKKHFSVALIMEALKLMARSEGLVIVGLKKLLVRIRDQYAQLTDSSGRLKPEVEQALTDILQVVTPEHRAHALALFIECDIPVPTATRDADAAFARMLQRPGSLDDKLFDFLTTRTRIGPVTTGEDNHEEENTISLEHARHMMDAASQRRIIPAYLYDVLELSGLRHRREFIAMAADFGLPMDANRLIEHLWEQHAHLTEHARRHYACALLETIRRCLGTTQIAASEDIAYIREALLTAEASLLQNATPTRPRAIAEMRELARTPVEACVPNRHWHDIVASQE